MKKERIAGMSENVRDDTTFTRVDRLPVRSSRAVLHVGNMILKVQVSGGTRRSWRDEG